MKVLRSRLLAMLAFGAVLMLAAAIGLCHLPWAAQWLDVGGVPRRADAVVLLNGSTNTRPFVAAALVHGGWAPQILLNTVADHPNQVSGDIPPSFEITLKVLDYCNVPANRVTILDSAATTTFDEAKAVAVYLAAHPARRLMIVTEGPHTRRARWIFQRVLADPHIEIAMVSSPTDEFDSNNWWRSEAGFLFVVSEYFKLFFYGLRYGWLGYEIALGVVLAACLSVWFRRRRKLASSKSSLARSLGGVSA